MADLSQFKPFTVKVGCLLCVVLVLSMAYEFQFPHCSSSLINRLLITQFFLKKYYNKALFLQSNKY